MQEKWKEKNENERYLSKVTSVLNNNKRGIVVSLNWQNAQEVEQKMSELKDEYIEELANPKDDFLSKYVNIVAYTDAILGHGYSPQKLANFSFMQSYDLLKKLASWDETKNRQKPEKGKLKNFELDLPYNLAKEYFVVYAQGVKNRLENENNKISIADLFTYNELIELGGDGFVQDCYSTINALGLKHQEIDDEFIVNNAKTEIQKAKQKKTEEATKAAKEQEKKLKYFAIGELKTLPFTGGIGIALGLGAFFGFEISGVLLLPLIGVPIVFGAVVIGPYVGRKSRQVAIDIFVQKIQIESEQNLDSKSNLNLNDKLEQKKVEYEKYKQKQQEKGNEENSKNSEIEKMKPSKIVDDDEKSKKNINPLQVINNEVDNKKDKDLN